MGWLRTILLGNVGLMLDQQDTEEKLELVRTQQRSSRVELKSKDIQISGLKRELGQQKLAIEALTRFLVSEGIVDPEKLAAFIEAVDAEDGVVDGQLGLGEVDRKLRLIVPPPTPPDAG